MSDYSDDELTAMDEIDALLAPVFAAHKGCIDCADDRDHDGPRTIATTVAARLAAS